MPASNKYKQIIYILGTTACGKTTTAEAFKYLYLADVINADLFYDFAGVVYDRFDHDQLTLQSEQAKYPDIDEWKRKWFRYKLGQKRSSTSRTLVIEGSTLGFKRERDVIESLVSAPTTIILLEPNNWEELYTKKHGGRPMVDMRSDYRNSIDADYILVTDINEILTPLGYQRIGFTDKKWQALKLGNIYGKSMLDLGCSAGWFNMFATTEGIGSYTGVDNYWRNIIKARSDHYGDYVLSDIQDYLKKLKSTFDIVVMASTLHYFKNKEEIIKMISKHTSEVFVLEIPVNKDNHDLNEYPVEGQTYTIPTVELVIEWMGKYFSRVEIVGQSVPPDNSYRLVFKGWK